MLKLIMCVKRLPELTREEFDAYWRNSHASLVRKYAAILGIRRYIQTYPLCNLAAQRALEQGRGSDRADFDGCAELWWDDLDAHLTARKTVDGLKTLQALIDDERRFVDLSRSQLWYGEERAIL
ncbi:EthD domain-containing protein [Brenneria rubrifaciens]|uniref:Ethyl tert-butyl ether degradation protein EthD n=1 Tax=Brenneria rubrifaciens TaxID=55213 RepID=A0A4P8QRI4_9GAMM|nr:EthD domain-containing protein [Brenneria rubrifaciens]QCR08149.1 ethyl tert-butyl ether degradation protein EthD [Brenneria rubrifaciens]QCR09024.1 ethyl tert-butyl ether degradation protein EthD [Brenneria rubrifaciens]